jgi:hypothetical protein
MKKFEDLEFNPNPSGMGGVQSILKFENGYGVSVIKTPYSYGGDKGKYEMAVLDPDGKITYNTPITNDVLGYLSEDEVSEYMIEVQELIIIKIN